MVGGCLSGLHHSLETCQACEVSGAAPAGSPSVYAAWRSRSFSVFLAGMRHSWPWLSPPCHVPSMPLPRLRIEFSYTPVNLLSLPVWGGGGWIPRAPPREVSPGKKIPSPLASIRTLWSVLFLNTHLWKPFVSQRPWWHRLRPVASSPRALWSSFQHWEGVEVGLGPPLLTSGHT